MVVCVYCTRTLKSTGCLSSDHVNGEISKHRFFFVSLSFVITEYSNFVFKYSLQRIQRNEKQYSRLEEKLPKNVVLGLERTRIVQVKQNRTLTATRAQANTQFSKYIHLCHRYVSQKKKAGHAHVLYKSPRN